LRNAQGPALAAAAKDAQHAIPQVGKIGGARLEILVGCRIVLGDLLIDDAREGNIRRHAVVDCGEHRIEKFPVLEQRHLEFENLCGLAARGGGNFGDLPAGSVNRPSKRFRLLERRSRGALATRAGIDAHELPMGKTDRGGSAAVGQPCRVLLHVSAPFPGSRRQPDRPAP
jgi:hypothetical protein